MSKVDRSTMLFVEDEKKTGELYIKLLGSRFQNLNIIWKTEGQKAIDVINELHEQILIVLTDGNLADQTTGTEVIEGALEKKIPNIILHSADFALLEQNKDLVECVCKGSFGRIARRIGEILENK